MTIKAAFTGYDSAWGASNSGATCDLVLQEDGSLQLDGDPVVTSWNQALHLAKLQKGVDLHVWAIDQPVCVRNETGCRPVERDLARALMADFECGAHSCNLGNPCWARGAQLWNFLHSLGQNGYVHNPMAIPSAKSGLYYFECYPHPALLGFFNLDRIVKYKVRHNNVDEWRRLLELLRSLATAELPIRNICSFVQAGLVQNKDNEDKLDAIICGYAAAYWWKFGTQRSSMIGDLATGYIITPHSKRTYAALAKVFNGRMNHRGLACAPQHPAEPPGQAELAPSNFEMGARDAGGDILPIEPPSDWSQPVQLMATDTGNLWRTSRGTVINSWMDANRMTGWHLWVRFIDEDGEPAVMFVPFMNQGQSQGGMRPATLQMNKNVWRFLVADATRDNPLYFRTRYRYERIQ